jgi:hypothetical protein
MKIINRNRYAFFGDGDWEGPIGKGQKNPAAVRSRLSRTDINSLNDGTWRGEPEPKAKPIFDIDETIKSRKAIPRSGRNYAATPPPPPPRPKKLEFIKVMNANGGVHYRKQQVNADQAKKLKEEARKLREQVKKSSALARIEPERIYPRDIPDPKGGALIRAGSSASRAQSASNAVGSISNAVENAIEKSKSSKGRSIGLGVAALATITGAAAYANSRRSN